MLHLNKDILLGAERTLFLKIQVIFPLALVASLSCGCDNASSSDLTAALGDSGAAPEASTAEEAPNAIEEVIEEEPEPIPEEHKVLAFRDGEAREFDVRRAAQEKLTIVDLRDTWAPRVLRGTAELPSTYKTVYVDLANERGEPVDWADPRTADYYLEVYGISPALSTIKKRYDHEHEQECFNDIDYQILRDYEGFIAYRAQSRTELKARSQSFRTIERRLKKLSADQGVERFEDVEGQSSLVASWKKRSPNVLVLRAAQERLKCEKLFPGRGSRYIPGGFDWNTHIALLNFERRHRFYGWGYLNAETAEAMSWNPEETAFHTLRRALTERVIDAAGIIEDGSTMRRGKVATYVGADGQEQEVRNLTEEFSEAAFHHLGLGEPEAAIAFLETHDFSTFRVAIPLPELPEYYSDHMDLEAVINRGDVWYDFPYDAEGNEIAQPRGGRPTTTLYANYEGAKIPLVRYGTTVGGWRSTVRDGVEYWAYKNSDIGRRVWRKIIGAPSWIPPDSTPIRSLVTKRRRTRGRRWEVNRSELGPGYASAYGMVMGVHEMAVERGDETVYMDNGIRSHGSVNYQSIQKRHSHGCHRLHNHLALRLFGYVLAHRNHKRLGQEEVGYRRSFTYEETKLSVSIDTRGYRFDMEPPIPVMVTRGRILGKQRTPITEYIIKPSEAERLRLEAEAAAQADAGISADGGVPLASPLSTSPDAGANPTP